MTKPAKVFLAIFILAAIVNLYVITQAQQQAEREVTRDVCEAKFDLDNDPSTCD